ncbi:MAG: VOC family protein [Chitinophagaceae bacterium]
MTECVPFLQVRNVDQTIKWYEDIGFTCVATNLIWEPGCELNWARIEWEGAAFMIGPDERDKVSEIKDSGLWFNVDSIEEIINLLKSKYIGFDLEPETFYGRKVVTFKDINSFQVSFSCELTKK